MSLLSTEREQLVVEVEEPAPSALRKQRIRRALARKLRKVADLIDPRVPPSSTSTLRIEIDADDAEEKLSSLSKKIEDLRNALDLLRR